MLWGRMWVGLAMVVAAVGWVGPTVPAGAAAPMAGPTLSYGTGGLEALVPARLLDTRNGTGAAEARVGAGDSVDLQVTGRGGVPESGVGAVVLNVTAVSPTAASFVTVWPTGEVMPEVSNLNTAPGDVVPNLVVVKVGRGGQVSLYNAFGEVDLLADVAGWFPEGSGLEPLVPARVLDTRAGNGAPQARVGPGDQFDLQVTGRGGVPANGVGAVVLNVTAVWPTADSFVTVWPTGEPMPEVSNLNMRPGVVVPNLAVVMVGEGGMVSLFNAFGDVDLVADVAGWFPVGGGFQPLVPERVLDTREGIGAPVARVGAGASIDLQVTGYGGIPDSGVGAVVLNVTAAWPTAYSFVTVWPAGSTRPEASNLNLVPGGVRPNLVIVKVGEGGVVSLFNAFGEVDLIADVAGWFPDESGGEVEVTPWVGTVFGGAGDVVSATDSTVVLSASADVPAVGGHLAVFPNTGAPGGVSGQVTAVTSNPDGTTTVELAPANLQDMFADVEVHGAFTQPAAADPPAAKVAAITHSTDGCDSGLTAGGGPSVTVGGLHGEFDYSLRRRSAQMSATVDTSVTWAVEGGWNLTCTRRVFDDRVLGAVGPLVFDAGLQLTFSVSATESATLEAQVPVTIGFAYEDGEASNLSGVNPAGSGDAAFVASVTASVGAAVTTSAKAFGVVGVEVGFGPELTASVSTPACVVIDAGLTLSIAAVAERWGIGWNFDLGSTTFGPLELYRSASCGQQGWSGTITVAIHRDSDQGPIEPRGVSNEHATYTLLPEQSSLRPDGTGDYAASIDGGGDATSYWPVWNGSGWSHCKTSEEAWSFAGVTRPGALALEREGQRWRYQPWLVSTGHYPPQGRIGGASGSTTGYDCKDGGPPVTETWTPERNVTKLGWEGGMSMGTGLLHDTDPASNRLAGTTTWTVADPPTSFSLWGNTSAWTYTVTYDLTLIELESD